MGMFDDLTKKEYLVGSPFDALDTKQDESEDETLVIGSPLYGLMTAVMLMIYASSDKAESVSDIDDFPGIDEDNLAEYKINKFHYTHSIRRFHSWSTALNDSEDDFSDTLMNMYLLVVKINISGWYIKEVILRITEVLNPRQRLIVMANLCDIAMQDGILVGTEKELLMLFNDAFKIEPSELNKIIEMTTLKNDIKEFGEID